MLLQLGAVLLFCSADASARAADAGGDAVECANLIYAGTRSSVCFSEEFLSTVATETSINTSRKFKPVKLGDKEVFRFPFAVMTGEGAFTLTDEERANLKLYLEKGGFLLASAGCSSMVFLPIQPSPARAARSRSRTGPVSTYARLAAPAASARWRTSRASRGAMTSW